MATASGFLDTFFGGQSAPRSGHDHTAPRRVSFDGLHSLYTAEQPKNLFMLLFTRWINHVGGEKVGTNPDTHARHCLATILEPLHEARKGTPLDKILTSPEALHKINIAIAHILSTPVMQNALNAIPRMKASGKSVDLRSDLLVLQSVIQANMQHYPYAPPSDEGDKDWKDTQPQVDQPTPPSAPIRTKPANQKNDHWGWRSVLAGLAVVVTSLGMSGTDYRTPTENIAQPQKASLFAELWSKLNAWKYKSVITIPQETFDRVNTESARLVAETKARMAGQPLPTTSTPVAELTHVNSAQVNTGATFPLSAEGQAMVNAGKAVLADNAKAEAEARAKAVDLIKQYRNAAYNLSMEGELSKAYDRLDRAHQMAKNLGIIDNETAKVVDDKITYLELGWKKLGDQTTKTIDSLKSERSLLRKILSSLNNG